MKLYIDPTHDLNDLERVATDLSIQLYDTRDDGIRSRGMFAGKRALKISLRPLDDTFRLIRDDPYSKSGRRRVWAVCWHGHWHFMRRVFDLDPTATFDSAVDRWSGLTDFLDRAGSSQDRNIGSQMYPSSYGNACDCDAAAIMATDETAMLVGVLVPGTGRVV